MISYLENRPALEEIQSDIEEIQLEKRPSGFEFEKPIQLSQNIFDKWTVNRMNWEVQTSWIFNSLQDDRPRQGQKKMIYTSFKFIVSSPLIFAPPNPFITRWYARWRPKIDLNVYLLESIALFQLFPLARLLSFVTLSLRDDSRAEAKNSSAAMLYWKCSPRNKAPAQMWLDIYHQYISNKVCNQYILWTRNLNRHPEIIQLMHRFV